MCNHHDRILPLNFHRPFNIYNICHQIKNGWLSANFLILKNALNYTLKNYGRGEWHPED